MSKMHDIKKRFMWLNKTVEHLVMDYGAKETLRERIDRALTDMFDDEVTCCYCDKIVPDSEINYCVDCGAFYCSDCGLHQNGTCSECDEFPK